MQTSGLTRLPRNYTLCQWTLFGLKRLYEMKTAYIILEFNEYTGSYLRADWLSCQFFSLSRISDNLSSVLHS